MSNDPREDNQIASVREHANEHFERAVAMRRRLHQWPEIGNELPRTRDEVLASIEDLPLDVTLHRTTSGITALLEGSKPGPTLILRGDMDALPMPEDTEVEFSSRVDGCMHACGHDTHTAMLSSAARVLSERRDEIAGRVLFMFQPGEEGHHGAKFMLEEGLLDVAPMSDGTESPVDAAFAIHITSALPTGWVSTRPGPVMASADVLRVTITGKGGHASEPHRTVDPVPVACEIVTALNLMITRTIDAFDPAVLTVTRVIAGTTNNVIPETAMIEGTIRAVSESTRKKVHEGVKRVADGIAAAHGCGAVAEIEYGYPVTTNDDSFANFSLALAREVAGPNATIELPHPVMGAEDFSYLLQERPGAMVFLGATPLGADLAKAAPNHSNRVFFEEDAMRTGIALYSAAALRHLAPA
jgi:amidohydrolase